MLCGHQLAKLRVIGSCVLISLRRDRALLPCRRNANLCTPGKGLAAPLNGFITSVPYNQAIIHSWGYAPERITNRLVRSHISGLLQCCL